MYYLLDGKRKPLFIAAVVGIVLFTVLGFAMVITSLDITFGNVTSDALNWSVGFDGNTVSGVAEGTSSTGLACGDASITLSSVTINELKLSKPGDKCTYPLRIKNNGEIPAILMNISASKPNDVECNIDGPTMVCGNITYKLTTLSNTELPSGLTINATETYDFRLVVSYTGEFANAETSSQSGAKFSLFYTQSAQRVDSGDVEIPEGINGASVNYYKKFIADLTSNAPTDTTDMIGDDLFYDGTKDNNLRYVGTEAKNYLTFNDEEAGWRIIGFFNNIDDGIGNKTTRVKIVRNSDIGILRWGSNNDWVNSEISNMLNNGAYYTRSSQLYFNSTLNLNSIGLTATSKPYIDDAVWHLGGYTTNSVIASNMYEYERGSEVYENRDSTWIGKIGLIYPSDYGFSSKNCRTGLTDISKYSSSDCYNTSWFKNVKATADSSYKYFWMISSMSNDASKVYCMTPGNLCTYSSSNYAHVFPTLYLKSGVKISGGTGTKDDPFTLSY